MRRSVKWGRRDPDAALAWIATAEDPDGLRESRIRSAIKRISDIDPPSALDAAQTFLEGADLDGAIGSIFNRWARSDPRSALDAARDLSASTSKKKLDVLQSIGTGLQTWDGALTLLAGAQDPRERNALIAGIANVTQYRWDQQPNALPELAALIDTVTVPTVKIEAASHLYHGWIRVAPELAQIWYDDFCVQNPSAPALRP